MYCPTALPLLAAAAAAAAPQSVEQVVAECWQRQWKRLIASHPSLRHSSGSGSGSDSDSSERDVSCEYSLVAVSALPFAESESESESESEKSESGAESGIESGGAVMGVYARFYDRPKLETEAWIDSMCWVELSWVGFGRCVLCVFR
jgi:hypothetical protein